MNLEDMIIHTEPDFNSITAAGHSDLCRDLVEKLLKKDK